MNILMAGSFPPGRWRHPGGHMMAWVGGDRHPVLRRLTRACGARSDKAPWGLAEPRAPVRHTPENFSFFFSGPGESSGDRPPGER